MSELVRITHEANDLSEWTTTYVDGGDLTTSTAAGMVGTYGMSGYIDDTNNISAIYTFGDIGTVSDFRFRFYIDLTDMTFQSGDNYYAGGIKNGATINWYHYVGEDATGKYIIWYFRNDSNSVSHNSGKLYLSDAPHYIEVHMVRASSTSSNDGEIYVYVDGGLEYSATNFDTYDYTYWGGNDSIQIGAISNIDAGTSGYFYYDDIIVRDDGTEIGAALTTVEDSVTADAVVLRVEPDSITADAVVKATLTDIYWLADAVIQRTYSGSVTGNAVVKKLDVSGSKTADAVVKRTESDSITGDAVVQKEIQDAFAAFAVIAVPDNQDSFTADAVILRTVQGGQSAKWWDPDDAGHDVYGAWQAENAESQAASYLDLTGNENDLGVGNAPGWSGPNGWEIDNSGGAQYLTTGFVPAADQSQTIIVKFSNVTTHGYFIGVYDDANSAFCLHSGSAGTVYYFNGSYKNAAPAMTSGNLAIAGNAGYRNGSSDVSSISAWVGGTSNDVYIGCVNNNGSPGAGAALYIKAVVIYNETLSGSEVAAVVSAMATLETPSAGLLADAVIYVEQAGSITGDSVVLRTKQQSITADARIEQVGTEVFELYADAVVLRTEGDTFTADAVTRRTEGDTFTADAFIVNIVSSGITGNAVIFKTTGQSITANAVFRRTEGDTFTADAHLVNTIIQGFTADAQIYKPITRWFFGYSVIKVPDNQDSITADAVVLFTEGDSITADAYIIYRISDDFSADAVIAKTQGQTITANAKIVAAGQKTFLASAVIKKTTGQSITADAYFLTGSTVQSGVTGDAIIKRARSSSVTANAVVTKTSSGIFYADAYIDSATKLREGSFIARARIVTAANPDPPVRFKIEGVQPPNPRGEPKGKGYRLNYPDPTGQDGYKRAVGAVGKPWIEINFLDIDEEVFDWYNSWVPDGDQWAYIDSVQCWNPYADGGAQWVIFEGENIRIWKPIVQSHLYGYYHGVKIIIDNLS